MNRKFISFLLTLVCILTTSLSVKQYLGRDRICPEIRIEKDDLKYADLNDEDIMIEGVTAFDDVDGDVSDTVIVESITFSDDEKTVRIVYAAEDLSGNVGKQSLTYAIEGSAKDQIKSSKKNDEEEQQIVLQRIDGLKQRIDDEDK